MNCIRLLIIPHSYCHPLASGWASVRGHHCQIDSCTPLVSIHTLLVIFSSTSFLSQLHFTFITPPFSLLLLSHYPILSCSTGLSHIFPDRSSSGHEPEPLWAPSVFPFVLFGTIMDLQTEIPLLFPVLNEMWTRNVDSTTSWDDDDPIRDQHTIEDSVVFPFLSLVLPLSLSDKTQPASLPPSPDSLSNSPSFAETCILFRKILFLAYTEMMHYKLRGHTALCIYVYTCIRGYHVEVRVCVRSCTCVNENTFIQERFSLCYL